MSVRPLNQPRSVNMQNDWNMSAVMNAQEDSKDLAILVMFNRERMKKPIRNYFDLIMPKT